MAGIQGYLVGILEEMPSLSCVNSGTGTVLVRSPKVAQDELIDAFMEKFAWDSKPRKEPTLEEHDRQHHPNGFNPETDTCKFREKLKQKDAVDLIYATSDVHHSGIEGITDKECGTIVLAGDFMEKAKHHADFGSAEKWWKEKFIPWCEDHKGQQIVIIGGNCDKWLYENRDKVEWPQNVHYLDDSISEVNGMKVYGTSWCPHNMNGAWEVDDEVLAKEFAKIPEGLDILVTHVPPKGDGIDLDHDTEFNKHFGSEALTKAILEKKPKIVLCGHVHSGSHKPIKIGDSIVMNVSRIDDDRYEQSFHGRRIGVERTDNGIGFLVDMDDEGKISLGKKEDIPPSIIKMRDALRRVARSIGRAIDHKDPEGPDKRLVAKAHNAIEDAKKDMEGFSHPKKKMLEASIEGFLESEKDGFKTPMKRVGKLYDGDRNGSDEYFHFSWESPWGTSTGHSSHGGGYSFAEALGGYSESGKGHSSSPYYSQSHHVSKFGKYKDPWKGGMGIDAIMAAWEEKHGGGTSSSESVDDIEEGVPPYDEDLPIPDEGDYPIIDEDGLPF